MDKSLVVDNVCIVEMETMSIQVPYKKLRGQDENPAPFLKSNIL
jgi:hypothetical protein